MRSMRPTPPVASEVAVEVATKAPAPAGAALRDAAPAGAGLARANAQRGWGAFACLVAAVVLVFASLLIGARLVDPGTVWAALTAFDGSADHAAIIEFRVPRTIAGVLIGIGLGLSGALIQALTRNPLADPGVLGVNAGASFAVVLGVAFFGAAGMGQFIWYAFGGAFAATVVVYYLGSRGRSGSTPVKLTLAGVAFGAVLAGITQGLVLLDSGTLDAMRRWAAGNLAAVGYGPLPLLAVCMGLGVLICVVVARPLNATALGDDNARSVGVNLGFTRVLVVAAVTVFAGASTAAAGPIGFVGLMVPHVCRWIVGPDQRWILLYTVLLSPVLLLAADIIGRVVARPEELEVGIITAFVGAPVLIWLVRRKTASTL